jgi:hypothetical protein|tara:strand:- start:84 stop:299 length:216 start_codon:yes stop_codon:yes gene_type:complete
MSNLKHYILDMEEKIGDIPGIMDKTSEAECVQEVINYALDYLDPFHDMDRFDTEIVEWVVKKNFNEYWSAA